MQFGKSIGTACSSFAITNIDDLFVLVTFFAEATTSTTLSPLKITIGQYLGFTILDLRNYIAIVLRNMARRRIGWDWSTLSY